MNHRPAWRLPFYGSGNPHPVQSAAFLAGRAKTRGTGAKCKATAKSTGQRCRQMALRGGKFCRLHHGLISASKAEAERYDRPVIIARKPRKKTLGRLSAETPVLPEGMPGWMDRLGPYQRGRAIEAWGNRLTAPDVWANELVMPRYRNGPDKVG